MFLMNLLFHNEQYGGFVSIKSILYTLNVQNFIDTTLHSVITQYMASVSELLR